MMKGKGLSIPYITTISGAFGAKAPANDGQDLCSTRRPGRGGGGCCPKLAAPDWLHRWSCSTRPSPRPTSTKPLLWSTGSVSGVVPGGGGGGGGCWGWVSEPADPHTTACVAPVRCCGAALLDSPPVRTPKCDFSGGRTCAQQQRGPVQKRVLAAHDLRKRGAVGVVQERPAALR